MANLVRKGNPYRKNSQSGKQQVRATNNQFGPSITGTMAPVPEAYVDNGMGRHTPGGTISNFGHSKGRKGK